MITAAIVVFIVKFWPAIIGVIGLVGAALFGWLKTKPPAAGRVQTRAAPFSAREPDAASRESAALADAAAKPTQVAQTENTDEGGNRPS